MDYKKVENEMKKFQKDMDNFKIDKDKDNYSKKDFFNMQGTQIQICIIF